MKKQHYVGTEPNFNPDPAYKEYFEEAIKTVEKKIDLLEKKHGNPTAIEFNKKQIELYKQYLSKIKEHTSEASATQVG